MTGCYHIPSQVLRERRVEVITKKHQQSNGNRVYIVTCNRTGFTGVYSSFELAMSIVNDHLASLRTSGRVQWRMQKNRPFRQWESHSTYSGGWGEYTHYIYERHLDDNLLQSGWEIKQRDEYDD